MSKLLLLEKMRSVFYIFFSRWAYVQLQLYMLFSCHYLRSIFGALAMICVDCRLPLFMTRIQYYFLAHCV